jgi:filamentous hemagglutinin family protein
MNRHASINRIYRLIFNEALGAWVPVSEITRGRGKRNGRLGRAAAALAPMLAAMGLALPAYAGAPPPAAAPAPTQLPTGGTVVTGSATITPGSKPGTAVLDIDQTSQRAVIDWNTFNLGSAAQVNFVQPNGNSATLNEVLDSNVSQIFGKITGTGQIFLVNPSGIYFGKSASVNVGSLAATTDTISAADFMAGNMTFARNGATGSVVNEGQLSAGLGGYIALLAPQVRNSGVIVARLGTVAMASGESISLTFDDNHLAGITVKPSAIAALVQNKGAVLAPGGLIILSAQAADHLLGGVVQNSGTVEATGLATKGGRIVLEASDSVENSGTLSADAGPGSPAGSVTVSAPAIVNSGTISAAAVVPSIPTPTLPPISGGSITLNAANITQTASGSLDASGASGGSVKLEATQDLTLAGSISAAAVDTTPVTASAAPSSAGAGASAGFGGSITLGAGGNIALESARLDASGNAGGGQIQVQGGGQSPSQPPADPPTLALLGDTELSTSSRRGKGGNVSLTADNVSLLDTSSIDASGALGGGDVFIGGGFHGQDPSIVNAQQTEVSSAVTIDASATQTGDGGQVVLWSDSRTTFAGSIAARGGAVSGSGGTLEVSSENQLNFTGSVNAGAAHGSGGSLLLDPQSITVEDSGADSLSNETFTTNEGTTSLIAPATITAVTNTGTAVTLQANTDITINSAIISSPTSGNGGAMTFQAGRSITVNASVISDNGNISFSANDPNAVSADRLSGTATFTNNSIIDAGTGTVSITMNTGTAGASGSIETGHVNAANLTVVQDGPTGGATAGAIDLGETNLTGNLSISANTATNVTNTLGSSGEAGEVIVRGTATISVGTGNVTINGPDTDFTIIGLTAGNVLLNNSTAMEFGTSVISGSLTETTIGPIASTGSVQVTGLTTLTANNGGFGYADPFINLSNSANHFAGGLVLDVPSTGYTGTGGYAVIRDSGALTVDQSTNASYLSITAGGAVTLGATGPTSAGTSVSVTTSTGNITTDGATTAGSSVTYTTSNGAVTTNSTTAPDLYVTATGAVSLGTSSISQDLTVSTSAAIFDTGVTSVGRQTTLTAGAANSITLGSNTAPDSFNYMRIVSADNVSLITANGVDFGNWNAAGGWTSTISGNLGITSGGNIQQVGQGNTGAYSAISVAGTTTFTANGSSQIQLLLGSTNPFNSSGQANLFTGGVTLASYAGNSSTGFNVVEIRDTNPAAVVLAGLTSVGTLSDVYLEYNSAPSITLPGMTVTGNLYVYGPSVANTATTSTNIISQAGPIVVEGNTIMAAASTGDIVLSNAGNDFSVFGIANTGARNLTIVNDGAIELYAPGYNESITGNLSVNTNNTGAISDYGNAWSVSGTAAINAGAANNINFTQNDTWGGAVSLTGDTVVFNPQTNLILGNSSIANTLSISDRNTGYSLTQLAGSAVVMSNTSATTTFNTFTGGITLAQPNNVFGPLAISNSGAINIAENSAISQASAWTDYNNGIDAVTLTTTNSQAITLTQPSAYMGNLTITQANASAASPGAVTVTSTADTAGITQGSGAANAWTTYGTTTLNSGAYSIDLNNPNNVLGPLQVSGATGSYQSVPSSVTIFAKGTAATTAITDVGGTGAWDVGSTGTAGSGVVKLVAYDTTGTVAGGGNIVLDNTGNVLGNLYLKATDATITENASITDGALLSNWDGAGDSGWSVSGAADLIVNNPSGKTITLANTTNLIAPLGISTTGTAGTLTSVLITDNENIAQSSIWNIGAAPITLNATSHAINLSGYGNVLGAISISTANGTPSSVAITENNPITQGATAWSLTGVPVTLVAQNNNSITLTDTGNVMGNLAITGGAVSITENGPITQATTAGGAWTTTGVTTLDVSASAGSGITLTNSANVLGPLAITGTPNSVSITENAPITQASAWVEPATPFILNSGIYDTVLSEAGNQLGALTITAQDATVTESNTAGITQGGAWTVPGTTTLTAGAGNPIDLNTSATSTFGTVGIVSASNADITAEGPINFAASTIAAGGTLTVSAGGAITQSGAISTPSLRLIGTGDATLTNTGNAVGTLAAGFSGGDLTFTNGGSFAVGVIGGTTGVTIGDANVTLTSVSGTVTGLANVNASSASLNVTTGTALSLPQLSIAGPQTYTAGGSGITLTTNLTSTAAGAITFNSPVTLGSDLTVQTTNSPINFNSTLAGANYQLDVNAGSGLVTFVGVVSGLGSTSSASPALTLTSSGATFDTTVSANNGLAVTGPVTFGDTVTLGDGEAPTIFGGLVTLGKVGGMNLSGYNNMTFNGGVLLEDGPATIDSNNSTLTFQTAGTVSGAFGLTLDSGTGPLNGLNYMGTNLTSLTVTALNPTIPSSGISIAGPQTYTATGSSNITLQGNVTSTAAGAITFLSPVSVGTSLTVASTNSPVVFASTVDGNSNVSATSNLTVNAGSGTTTFTGAVGQVTPLGNGTGAAIVLEGSGATTFDSTVQARSGITAAGPVSFDGNVTLADGDTGSAFNALVTSGGSAGNTLSGYGGMAFNGGLTVAGGPVSVLSNGSTISFGGPVGGAENLTLNALSGGAGTVTGLSEIGPSSTLTALNVTGETLSLPSGGLAVAGPMTFTAPGGITVNGDVGSSATPASGAITFMSPVTLATGPVAISDANAAVTFNGTVDGAEPLSINAGTGAVAFNGAVGGVTPLASLAVNGSGPVTLDTASITTSGAQSYSAPVTLAVNSTLTGDDVQFQGTLNGPYALTVHDSGTTTFGGVTQLSSLASTASGGIDLNTPSITTTDAQTYGGAVTLAADTALTGAGITFNGTVDGAHALTANATSGTLSLNGVVGGNTALTSLTADGNAIVASGVTTTGAQSYTANGVSLSSNYTTGGSSVTVTGPTTLTGNVDIATAGGNIAFSGATSTVNGPYSLTLTAGTGNVVLGAAVGSVTPLTAVTDSGYDLTLPDITTVGDLNQSYTALDNITLSQSRTLDAPVSFTADSDGNGQGSFILENGVSLTAANNNLSITAADISLGTSSTLSSGSGLMTITATDGRNIYLGGPAGPIAGQMTITGAELSLMSTSGGLNLDTTGSGSVYVNGITAAQSQNVTGALGLNAQGTGSVNFISSPSTFHAITADAPGGVTNIGVDLTAANAPIQFLTPVSVSGASTISSGGGNISFDSTLAVANNLTLDTGNGTLTFAGPVGSTQTLTLNLGGGSVSGLGELQNTLTGLTVNATSGIVLPAFTIDGPQVYNTATAMVTGNLGGIGITFNTPVTTPVNPSGVSITLNAGTGTLTFANSAQFNGANMTLTGDAMSFAGPVTGSGNLTLQPYTPSVNVAVGGSGSPIVGLNLTSAELAELPIGTLASLTIGSATGTGTLNVAGTLNIPGTPLTLNGGGGITQTGGAVTSGPLTLYAAGNPITLANGSNAFGAVAINGTPSALSLTNTLDIDQLGSAGWALGSAPVTLNAGTHNITLNNAGNTFGTLVLNGDNVQVTEAAGADIGASTVTGNLTVAAAGGINFSGALAATGNVSLTSSGEVTQSAPLTIGGNLAVTTTVNAGNVTLSNAGDTVMGNTLVGGNYSLTAGGSVSQAAGTSYQVAGSLDITGTDIVLGGAGNIAGSTTLSGSSTSTDEIAQAGVITLTSGTYAGNLTVISESASRSISSAPVSGNAIVLNNAGNSIAGSISVSASPPTVTTSGSDVQTGINQAAGTSISVSGVASFTAQASSVANSGNIDLTNAGNSFGTLVLSGNTINVANAATGATTLASALATGSLTLAAAGGVSQTGAISTPALSITADGNVALNNVANQVTTLSVTSGGNPISFVNSADLSIAGIDAGGSTVNLTAGGSGSLTQTAALQNVSALSADAGGAIVLTNAGNSIATLNTSTAGTGLELYNTGALGVAGIVGTATGDLSVRTTGDLTLGTAGQLEASAGNVVASTEGAGNFINDSAAAGSALVVGSGDRWLVYSDTPDLVAGPHTVKGGLTSSFRDYDATYSTYAPGAVTQSGNGFIYDYATPTLTVTATVVGTPTQVYGSTPTASLGYTVSGFVDSEDNAGNTITGGAATYSTALANTMNAGLYNITYTGGLTSSNYTLTPSATGAAYTVTPAVLTYNAAPASRTYGTANPALTGTVSGFVLGQNSSILSGTATWTSPATASSNAGQYAIDGSGYSAGSNYTFAQAAGNATALTVTPATLTVTANNDSTTYNGTNFSGGNGVTYSGFVNGQTYSDLGGTLTYGGNSQGARNAGSYTIAPGGLTDGNYAITYVDGTLTIGKANLTLTTSNVTKTYDGALDAVGTAVATDGTQLFGSDSVSGGTFAFTNANAGTGDKTVTVSGVTVSDGNSGNNYNVSYVANATSTINPASITVDTSNVTKTYDATLAANGTATLVSGTLYHNVSNGGAQDTLSGGTFAFTNANAGTGDKTVTTSGVTVNDGNGGGNYAVTYVDNTTSTINPAELTFVGTVADKTYDATTTATLSGYTLTGFIGDQTVDASAGAANFSDPNAGVGKTVTISGITLANGTNGGLAANYVVNPTAAATATIDPKVLTVNATVANKVYDGTTNATLESYGLAGFVGNQTVTGVGGTAAFASKNVGTDLPVTITGIVLVNGTNGGLATNYVVSPNATSNADITPATLQVAGVVALNKVYDGTTAANLDTQSAVLTGVISGDNVQVGSITGNFLTKNVGNNLAIVTSGFALTGTDAMDYTIVQPTGLTASITPRPLTVTATGTNKVYDGTTSATVTLTDNPVAGDALTVTSTNAFLDPNAGTGKYINVSNITISGADAEDYTVNSSTSAYANITPATLTVSATGINKVYDGNTAATVTLTDHPIAGGVVDVSYSGASFAGKNVGNGETVTVDGITLSGADAEDYVVNSTATTTADITPATLTVSAIGGSRPYNGTTAAPVTLTDNAYSGDQVLLTHGSANFANSSVGNGKLITVGGIAIAGGAEAGDYVLGNTTATATGNITTASNVAEETVWLLPPAPTQPLTPSTTTPPASTLDLTLPSGFGSGTAGSAPSTVAGASNTTNGSSATGSNTVNGLNGQSGGAEGQGPAVGEGGVNGQSTTGQSTTGQSTNGQSTVSESAAAEAQAEGLITVSLVQSATSQHPGLVVVSVPESVVASGAGFHFALPAEIREAAQTGEVRATLKNGKRLPAWLRYVPNTQTFVASAVPAGALPLEMLVRNRAMSWTVEVTEDKQR